jgi:hypothetical protein
MEIDGPICSQDEQTTYLSGAEPNWSSVDVDAPYTWCWKCEGVCTCEMESDDEFEDGGTGEYQRRGGNDRFNLSNECD